MPRSSRVLYIPVFLQQPTSIARDLLMGDGYISASNTIFLKGEMPWPHSFSLTLALKRDENNSINVNKVKKGKGKENSLLAGLIHWPNNYSLAKTTVPQTLDCFGYWSQIQMGEIWGAKIMGRSKHTIISFAQRPYTSEANSWNG